MPAVRNTLSALLVVIPTVTLAENDYPTLDRVNYALDCMDRHGGQTIDNLLSCSCEIDMVAARMPYEDFVDAQTYLQNKDTPGDKGDVFRESAHAKKSYNLLVEAQKEAEKPCFVRSRVARGKAKEQEASQTASGEPAAAVEKGQAEEAP